MNADGHLKTLGRYRIERVLGRGAMGLVYEGVAPRLDRPVAIKTILKSHLLDAALAPSPPGGLAQPASSRPDSRTDAIVQPAVARKA